MHPDCSADRNFSIIPGIVLCLLIVDCAMASASRNAALTAHACEGEELRLKCGPRQVIHVERANYGRYSTHVCNQRGELWATSQCQYDGSTGVVQRRCDGRSECRVLAVDDDFKDNCPDTFKYLAVVWRCREGEQASTDVSVTPDIMDQTIESSAIERSKPSADISSSTMPFPASIAVEPIPALDIVQKNFLPARASAEEYIFCEERETRDVLLPKTRAGFEAKVQCPNAEPGEGYAMQTCDLNGNWGPGLPNLSRCISRILRGIRRESKNADKEDDIKRLLHSIKRETRFSRLYGGDTLSASRSVRELVEQSFAVADRLSPTEQRQFAGEVNQIVVELASNLLNEHQQESWLDLSAQQRRFAAAELLESARRSGQLVALCLVRSDGTYTEKASNIFLEVSTVPVLSLNQLPSMSHYAPGMDNVQIPSGSLRMGSNLKTGFANVVFVSFEKRMGALLLPTPHSVPNVERQITQVSRQVSSQIVSVSFDSGKPMTGLAEPVHVTMAVDRTHNLSNPQCVFWDRLDGKMDGLWSTEGCVLLRENKTHVICSCDRLADFAVLMDVDGFEKVSPVNINQLILTCVGVLAVLLCLFCVLMLLFNSWVRKHLKMCTDRANWLPFSRLGEYGSGGSLGHRHGSNGSRKLSSNLLAHSSGSNSLKEETYPNFSYYGTSATQIPHLYPANWSPIMASSHRSSCQLMLKGSEIGYGFSTGKAQVPKADSHTNERKVSECVAICETAEVNLASDNYYCASDVSCGQDSGRGSLEGSSGPLSAPCPPPFRPPSPPALDAISVNLCCQCRHSSPNVVCHNAAQCCSNNNTGNNYIDADVSNCTSASRQSFPASIILHEHQPIYHLYYKSQSVHPASGVPGLIGMLPLGAPQTSVAPTASSMMCHKSVELLSPHDNSEMGKDNVYLTPNSSPSKCDDPASSHCCQTLPFGSDNTFARVSQHRHRSLGRCLNLSNATTANC